MANVPPLVPLALGATAVWVTYRVMTGQSIVPFGGSAQPALEQPINVVLPAEPAPPAAGAPCPSQRDVYVRAALLGVGVFLGLRVLGAIVRGVTGIGGPSTTTIVEKPIVVVARRKPRTRYVPGRKNGRKGVFIQRAGSKSARFQPFPRHVRRR